MGCPGELAESSKVRVDRIRTVAAALHRGLADPGEARQRGSTSPIERPPSHASGSACVEQPARRIGEDRTGVSQGVCVNGQFVLSPDRQAWRTKVGGAPPPGRERMVKRQLIRWLTLT